MNELACHNIGVAIFVGLWLLPPLYYKVCLNELVVQALTNIYRVRQTKRRVCMCESEREEDVVRYAFMLDHIIADYNILDVVRFFLSLSLYHILVQSPHRNSLLIVRSVYHSLLCFWNVDAKK